MASIKLGRPHVLLATVIALWPAGNIPAAPTHVIEVRNPYAERPVESPTVKLEERLRFEGTEEYVFSRIGDIAVDAIGRIYVVESPQHKVFVFDREGALVDSFGQRGEGPADFMNPSSLAIGNDGSIYVVDQLKVSVFDSTRTFVDAFNHGIRGAITNGVVLGAEKSLFISCFEVFGQQIIHKYAADGKRLISFCDSYATGTNEDVRTEQVYAGGFIDIDKSGRICYSQRTPYLIEKFSNVGELVMTVERDNGFVQAPRVVIKGDSREYYFGTAVTGFGLLGDGTMVNSVVFGPTETGNSPWPCFIDIFKEDGHLLGSAGLAQRSSLRCVDQYDYLYCAEYGEQVAVVRYQLKMRDD